MYEPRHEKRDVKEYANCKSPAVSPKPMLFTNECGRPMGNFSQRTRHVVLLMGQACVLKGWLDGKYGEPPRSGSYDIKTKEDVPKVSQIAVSNSYTEEERQTNTKCSE